MANNTGLEDPHLRALISDQHGVLSATQAVSCGLSRETMRRRVLRGLWQRPVPGVYALQSGPPNRLQWLIAAQLYAGEGSVLTGRAALSVYGLEVGGPDRSSDPTTADRVHALVPHRMRRQNVARLRITRTTMVPKPTRFGVLRVAPLARSVIDSCLAAVEDGDAKSIEAILAVALADGRVCLSELEDELSKAPRRHSGPLRAEIANSKAHQRATASRRLLEEIRVSGPHGALPDVAIYLGRARVAQAAAIWPNRAVAAVVDAPECEIRALIALGFAVVQVVPQQLTEGPASVLRLISSVLAGRPQATLPAGLSLLPLASTHSAASAGWTGLAPSAGQTPQPLATDPQRVLTANSPTRTGVSSVLPLGGTGHTK
jgi:hypothetical protein